MMLLHYSVRQLIRLIAKLKCSKVVKKVCWITYKKISPRPKKALLLHHEPKTIFFTLEIVPIGNS